MTDFGNNRGDQGDDRPPRPAQDRYAPGGEPPTADPGGYGSAVPPAASWIGQPANLGPRFVARLIDFILLGAVSGIIGSIIVAGMLMRADASVFSTYGIGRSVSNAANAATSVISALIALAYFTLMEANRGQTLGKMVLKLQTQGPGGGHPTMREALRRNAFTAIPVLGVIPVLGAYAGLLSLIAIITIAVTIRRDTSSHRGWHDDFAGGTTVVRVG
jgi:uncharacterized RDD family membrane protein YckC